MLCYMHCMVLSYDVGLRTVWLRRKTNDLSKKAWTGVHAEMIVWKQRQRFATGHANAILFYCPT